MNTEAKIALLIEKRDRAGIADKALRARTDITKKEKLEIGHAFMIDYLAAEIQIRMLRGPVN